MPGPATPPVARAAGRVRPLDAIAANQPKIRELTRGTPRKTKIDASSSLSSEDDSSASSLNMKSFLVLHQELGGTFQVHEEAVDALDVLDFHASLAETWRW